jgi:O-antigen/teichoic acid export membrane protein
MCSSIVLTRLLLPQYFGLMALVSTVMLGLQLLSDVGLLPSVIGNSRGDEPVFLNTAWTVQIIRGVGLWLVALILTHPLAVFYHDARLNLIIPVLALTSVINGLNSTSLLTAARHIGVKRIYTVDLLSQFFTVAVTALWAFNFPSVWALIGGTLSGAAIKACLSHMPRIMPGHRNSFAWEKESLRSLVNFGKWIMLGTAFYFFASQADRLILGKLVSFTTLGIYGVAFTIADIPRQVITQFASRVGFPFVAKMTHLPLPEFRRTVLRYRLYCLAVGAVLISIVVFLGPIFVKHVYDVRYRDAVWMIPILSLGLWHTLLYSTTGTILFSLERPKYNAIGTACYCVAMFVGLPVAFHFWGLWGAVISVAAGDFPFYLVLEYGAAREKVSVWRQDFIATSGFLALLGVGVAIRHLVLLKFGN